MIGYTVLNFCLGPKYSLYDGHKLDNIFYNFFHMCDYMKTHPTKDYHWESYGKDYINKYTLLKNNFSDIRLIPQYIEVQNLWEEIPENKWFVRIIDNFINKIKNLRHIKV